MTTRRFAGNAGFTLVEMLIAVAIAGIVGMAALTVFTTSTRTTTAQTDLTQTQQSVRASMDHLSLKVRTAGFGLPERQTFSLTFGPNTFTRPVTVTNNNAGPDTLTLVGIGYDAGALNAFGSNGCNAAGVNCLSLSSTDPALANAKYISVGGASFQEVAGVAGNIITLTKRLELPDDFFRITPTPSIYLLQALQYSIATDLLGCSALVPCLAVQDFSGVTGGGQRNVLAQGIEDMQIGIYDSPIVNQPATFSAGATTSSATLSALRINLVGKSQTPDNSGIFQRPALEDRVAGANDSFRRRVLTSVVKIRNPRPGS